MKQRRFFVTPTTMIFWIAFSLPFSVAHAANNEKFEISLTDAPLRNAIRALAESAKINIILPDEGGSISTKKVTVRLTGIPPEEALRQLVRSNGLALHEGKETWVVSQGTAETPKEKRTEQELLTALKKERPQVLLECQVVEASESALQDLGIQWGSPTGKASATWRAADQRVVPNDFVATISALIGKGQAKVLARPRIMTISGEEAIIRIGSRIPFAVPVSSTSSTIHWRVEYLDAGISLRITPDILADRSITMHLHPEVSSIAEWRSTAAGEFPVIRSRQADATVHVNNGETIQIGGLLSETERENLSKVPLLGDLPLLGLPFQQRTTEKTRTEVIFLITPKLQ